MNHSFSDDTYAAQREEFLELIKSLAADNRSLVVHGEERLTTDDLVRVRQKIKNGYGFSSREVTAFTDAGFLLDKIFPGR